MSYLLYFVLSIVVTSIGFGFVCLTQRVMSYIFKGNFENTIFSTIFFSTFVLFVFVLFCSGMLNKVEPNVVTQTKVYYIK
jgi:hypothetical protein